MPLLFDSGDSSGTRAYLRLREGRRIGLVKWRRVGCTDRIDGSRRRRSVRGRKLPDEVCEARWRGDEVCQTRRRATG